MRNSLSLINKHILPFLLITFILLSAISLGSAIVYQKYNIMLAIGAVFLVVIALKSDVIPIAIILLTISLADWATEGSSSDSISLLPPQIMWMAELLCGLLFVKAVVNRAVTKQKINLFGIWVVIPFLGVAFASLVYNGTNIISALLFLRLLFRYYLLFLAVINLNLNEKSMKLINNALVFIFIIQLPLSAVKLFVYGSGEKPVGLSAHSAPTSIALIAIGFLLSYYLLYKKSILYILLSLGFVGFSIIGAKKAFIFFMPVVLAYFAWSLRGDIKNMFRYVVISIPIFVLSCYLILRLHPVLNPQQKVGGKFDPVYAVTWAYTYITTSEHSTGLTAERLSTTINIFNRLYDRGLSGFSFGYGPGAIIESRFNLADRREVLKSRFGVVYGVTGLNWLASQVGLLGAFIYILLFYLILRRSAYYFTKEIDPYWRSFGLGMVLFSFIMLLINLSYVPLFNDDVIPAFYFCLAGFIIKRIERCKKNQKKYPQPYIGVNS